jgi:hypothetical protein
MTNPNPSFPSNRDDIFTTEEHMNPPLDFTPGEKERKYKVQATLMYPCILMETDAEGIESYLTDFLRGQVTPKGYLEDPDAIEYALYFKFNDQPPVGVGYLQASRLKVVLDSGLFENFRKSVHLSPTEIYEGDLVYAFCSY